MGELVKIWDRPIIGRLFAVGDLHGSYNLLMAKLEHIGFDFEKDLLVSVGDLIDRGSQNVECINLLDKEWFTAVKGNHEDLCARGLENKSYYECHMNNGGEWFYDLDYTLQKEIISKIKNLPIALEIACKGKKFGIVHGHIEQNDWQEFKDSLINFDQAECIIKHQRFPTEIAMWSRDRLDPDAKQYTHVNGVDLVIMGHTVTLRPCQRDNCIWIDTGAVHNGNLTIIQLA